LSVITGRWSELIAEHHVRCAREGRSFVFTMPKTLGVVKGLYGLVVGVSGPKIRQDFSSA
jgi:hypothetical protein